MNNLSRRNMYQRGDQRTWRGGAPDETVIDQQGTPYSITLNMDASTVRALGRSQFKLFLFKAVSSAMGGGVPTVWASSTSYSTNTTANWVENYYAYASTQMIASGVSFEGSDTKQIDLGQTLEVRDQALTSVDPKRGFPGRIAVQNLTSTAFSCGLAQPSPSGGGAPAPICAFPLYGRNLDIITPVQKVALMFATPALNVGSVVEQAFGPAVLVDLTTLTSASLTYDLNGGWGWSGNIAKELVGDEFVPALIGNSLQPDISLSDPITSVSVWEPKPNDDLAKGRLLASGASGFQDWDNIAARLVLAPGETIPQDYNILVEYKDNNGEWALFQVKCDYIGSDTVPYNFKKLRRVDTVLINGGQV